MDPRDKCFRCGKDIRNTANQGQITISGYYTPYSMPYYDNYHLCEDCHAKLYRIIGDYLMEAHDDSNDA